MKKAETYLDGGQLAGVVALDQSDVELRRLERQPELVPGLEVVDRDFRRTTLQPV